MVAISLAFFSMAVLLAAMFAAFVWIAALLVAISLVFFAIAVLLAAMLVAFV